MQCQAYCNLTCISVEVSNTSYILSVQEVNENVTIAGSDYRTDIWYCPRVENYATLAIGYIMPIATVLLIFVMLGAISCKVAKNNNKK